MVRAFCFRTVRPPIRLATPPVGDEVALFSGARHSGIPETKATVTPRAFGCGCAALRTKLVVEAARVWFWMARGASEKRSPGVVLVRGCQRLANSMGPCVHRFSAIEDQVAKYPTRAAGRLTAHLRRRKNSAFPEAGRVTLNWSPSVTTTTLGAVQFAGAISGVEGVLVMSGYRTGLAWRIDSRCF